MWDFGKGGESIVVHCGFENKIHSRVGGGVSWEELEGSCIKYLTFILKVVGS